MQRNTVRLINFATAGFFATDMLLRCIADGVLLTPDAYLLVRCQTDVCCCTGASNECLTDTS